MLKRLSRADKNRLVCQYQADVECVVRLGVCAESAQTAYYQTRALSLVRNLTQGLNLYHAEFALSEAYSELDRLAREVSHDSHTCVVHNCACCQAMLQDQNLRDSR